MNPTSLAHVSSAWLIRVFRFMRNCGAASAEIELALEGDACAVFDAVVSLRKTRKTYRLSQSFGVLRRANMTHAVLREVRSQHTVDTNKRKIGKSTFELLECVAAVLRADMNLCVSHRFLSLLLPRTQDTPQKRLVTAQLHPSAPPFFHLNRPTRQPDTTSQSPSATATGNATLTTDGFESSTTGISPFPPAPAVAATSTTSASS